MARWRLAAPHYLKVPGTEWEYKETDRTTGRPKRFMFPVPLLLDPANPMDCNYKDGDDQQVIVCYEGKGQPKDIVYIGEPTPDMVPLDEEATAISKGFEAKWKHPIESLSSSYADTVLDDLQKEVADARTKAAAVEVTGLTEVLAAMTQMMKQNQELLAGIMSQRTTAPATQPTTARRA